jgi:hypothetical protein
MTRKAFSGHCERFEKSRGNLKTSLSDFFHRPGLNDHPQAWTPLCWNPVLEAATHSLLILLGGILKAEGFGDGFSPAKHIPCGSRNPGPLNLV